MFLYKSNKVPTSVVIETVEFVLQPKKIKNLYIRIKGDGKAYVSAPLHLTNTELQQALISHLPWVKVQLTKLPSVVNKKEKRFQAEEIHYLWGQPYTLKLQPTTEKQAMEKTATHLIMHVKNHLTAEQREKLMDDFYRAALRGVMPNAIQHWEEIMGVQSSEWRLKKMKTRWGTCNTRAKRIWLNVELAKYPFECFEYVLVHELVHLLERSHNARFKALMTEFLPDWQIRKKALNQLALKSY